MSRQKVCFEDKVIKIQIEKHQAVIVLFLTIEKKVETLLMRQKKWKKHKISILIVFVMNKKMGLQNKWIGKNSKKINSIIGECAKIKK